MKTEFGFIGHCYDPVENHDKIWGYFYRPTPGWDDKSIPAYARSFRNVCIFWARRGKSMQFKSALDNIELAKTKRSKLNKGYNELSTAKFLEIWPSFIQECEEKLMWDVLSGKIK